MKNGLSEDKYQLLEIVYNCWVIGILLMNGVSYFIF